MQIWMYLVPNQNVEIARIVNRITRRYVPVYTATEQYKVVWYYSIVRTNKAMCQLSTYSLVLGILKLLQVCTTICQVCPQYVLGMYSVHTGMY
jgi:hypothetical protein